MKKKILIALLLMIPFAVNATSNTGGCDYSLFVQYQKLAGNVQYETSYSKSDKAYSVTFYNVTYNKLKIILESTAYQSDEEGKLTINKLAEGSTLSFIVDSSDLNCSQSLSTIVVTLPYYNTIYDNSKCNEYRNKLTICTSKFLNYKPTEDLLDSMIKNYNNSIPVQEPEDPDSDRTILDDIKDFTVRWGIQILLVVISSSVTILIFNGKLRKVKHGI